MMKKLFVASALTVFALASHAQTGASTAASAVSAIPMAVVVSAGMAANSTAKDASTLGLSVPVALAVAGERLIVDMASSTAKGVSYGLRRASDGATVSIEIAGVTAGKASLAVGSVVTVVAITGGVILSAAGEAIAFVPNKVGKTLLHNRVIK